MWKEMDVRAEGRGPFVSDCYNNGEAKCHLISLSRLFFVLNSALSRSLTMHGSGDSVV
jgi:hypothetical protein